VLFALVMSLNGFVFAVVTVQLVPLLEAAGLAAAAAVWVASMKGFAQFGGRLVEIVFGRNLRAITVARIAIGVLPVSFALLLAHNLGMIGLGQKGNTRRAFTDIVSANYFSVLGVLPAQGRTFTSEEETPGRSTAVGEASVSYVQ
jgi:hypothetical protein